MSNSKMKKDRKDVKEVRNLTEKQVLLKLSLLDDQVKKVEQEIKRVEVKADRLMDGLVNFTKQMKEVEEKWKNLVGYCNFIMLSLDGISRCLVSKDYTTNDELVKYRNEAQQEMVLEEKKKQEQARALAMEGGGAQQGEGSQESPHSNDIDDSHTTRPDEGKSPSADS